MTEPPRTATPLEARFPRVPLLAATDLNDGIRGYVDSEAMRALVAEFSGPAHEPMPEGDLAANLAWLDRFSERWDFRGGQERNLVTDVEMSDARAELVLAAADSLGLTGHTVPALSEYEHMLILGGLVRACIARPLHCARLIEDGLRAGSVTALGGYRPLGGNELPLADSFGMAQHDNEFDVMDEGVRMAFSLGEPLNDRGVTSEEVGASWRVREYSGVDGLDVRVIAAPSSEPGVRRANTPDTYAWFASEVAHLQHGQRLLVVTTSIYVPFQHANAVRMFALPFGVSVETVGAEPGDLDARLSQQFLPHNYLQEIRSTIRALRELCSIPRTD
jgi:hypothetical protein